MNFQKECRSAARGERDYNAVASCQDAIDSQYECINAIKEGLMERKAERRELVRELRELKQGINNHAENDVLVLLGKGKDCIKRAFQESKEVRLYIDGKGCVWTDR